MSLFIKQFALLILILVTASCSNNYANSYQPLFLLPSQEIQPIPYSGMIHVFQSYGNFEEDKRRMFEEGYILIGWSSFTSPREQERYEDAEELAQKIGAAIIILDSRYQGTSVEAVPLFIHPRPYYTPYVDYMPYYENHYSQTALFFAPLARQGFGANFSELSPTQKQTISSNKGVMIASIRKESPAYHADFLPGDILLSLNQNPIESLDKLNQLLIEKRGQPLNFTLWRGNQKIDKTLTIPNAYW
jgi:membrane-associated protease RseP (regulator of RpoE activity)